MDKVEWRVVRKRMVGEWSGGGGGEEMRKGRGGGEREQE